MDSKKSTPSSVSGEKQLINFLKIATTILNSQNALIDIDMLSNAIKLEELIQVNLISENVCEAVFLSSSELKSLFLNIPNMKKCLEMCVQSLLDYLIESLKNYEIKNHTIIVEYVEKICSFLNACQESKTILSIKNNVISFLNNLLLMLDDLNLEYVTIKGPINYAILKTLSAFKEVNFAQEFIYSRILDFFKKSMMDSGNYNSITDRYIQEDFMIYLTLLKEMLQYSMNINAKPLTQTNSKFFRSFKDVLKEINRRAPEFIGMVVADCVNLLT